LAEEGSGLFAQVLAGAGDRALYEAAVIAAAAQSKSELDGKIAGQFHRVSRVHDSFVHDNF
jgi:hypothetical protein